MRGLKDRTVLVTGGANGIGAAIVRRLAEEGCAVGILDMDAAERNIGRMAAYFRGTSASLRPHVKVHKSPWLAQKQIDANLDDAADTLATLFVNALGLTT